MQRDPRSQTVVVEGLGRPLTDAEQVALSRWDLTASGFTFDQGELLDEPLPAVRILRTGNATGKTTANVSQSPYMPTEAEVHRLAARLRDRGMSPDQAAGEVRRVLAQYAPDGRRLNRKQRRARKKGG